MYAIVRTGGRQQKVAVGDVIEVDRLATKEVGDSVELSTVLIVDGEAITSDPWVLAGVKVEAEVLDHHKGEKIRIQKYKNKTGYKKRIGHRQLHTQLKITGIPAPASK